MKDEGLMVVEIKMGIPNNGATRNEMKVTVGDCDVIDYGGRKNCRRAEG
jgi:hypothetical protein